jgi:hypothetical protein
MKLKVRIGLFVLGIVIALYGLDLIHLGIMSYVNARYRAAMYSPGVVATGVFFSLLAFLPPASWVDRLTRRKKVNAAPHPRHRHSR